MGQSIGNIGNTARAPYVRRDTNMLESRENYLTRAHEAHQQAMQCNDAEIHRRLLGIAKAYRDLADLSDSKVARVSPALQTVENQNPNRH